MTFAQKIKHIPLKKFEVYAGLYLLLSVILDQIASLYYAEEWSILWYCSVSAILLAIGCFAQSKKIPTIVLIISLVAQVPWIIDFVLELFGLGFGRNAIMISYGLPLIITATNLHVILIPIAGYLVYRRGFATNALGLAFIYGFLLLTVTFLFTNPSDNINCVFNSCDEDVYLLEPRFAYFEHFVYRGLLFWAVMITTSFYTTQTLFKRLFEKEKT